MTSALLPDALSPLRANPSAAAILLDIDGTLAPIVEHAADAHVPEGTRQLLIAVARRYGIVACVSGRRASEARAMVSVGSITYLGSHGVELLRAGWTEPVLDPRVGEWAQKIGEFAREADTPELRRLRVRLEDKGPIAAFHWRGAPDQEGARSAVDALASSANHAGLWTHWGRKVLEVRPPVQIDKGSGIKSFLTGSGAQTALYIGDDTTDLDAFAALCDLRDSGQLRAAIRIGVRSEEGPAAIVEKADVVVEGTDGVRQALAALLTDSQD